MNAQSLVCTGLVLLSIGCSSPRPAASDASQAAQTWSDFEEEDGDTGTVANDPLAKAADQRLATLVNATSPGAAVLILSKGEIKLLKGYGLADVATRRPITPDSVFDLASVSKHLTATSIMMLQDAGQLRVTDDVTTYLPELKGLTGGRAIHVEDLLHHVSGVGAYEDTLIKSGKFRQARKEDVLDIVAKQPMLFPTGSKYQYSNSGYVLLALLSERVSGILMSSFLQQNVFGPLGMSSTLSFDHTTVSVPNRVTGYECQSNPCTPATLDGGANGDGNVFTSLNDMVRWETALDSGQILSKAAFDQMHTSGKLDDGSLTNYGYGWVLENGADGRIASHSGGWTGVSTMFVRWLDAKVTVIILSNVGNQDLGSLAGELGAPFVKAVRGGTLTEPQAADTCSCKAEGYHCIARENGQIVAALPLQAGSCNGTRNAGDQCAVALESCSKTLH